MHMDYLPAGTFDRGVIGGLLVGMLWFVLVGLIHDLGKVLCLFGEPQWAVVGDTFPVGCAFSGFCVERCHSGSKAAVKCLSTFGADAMR